MTENDPSFKSVITEAQLAALREAYDPAVMAFVTRNSLAEAYPPGAEFIGALMDSLYSGEPISHADRERCLIALLAVNGEPMPLAVHIYWGLVEGLSPEEIAHTLLLTGAYSGVPKYAAGLLVLQKVVAALKETLSADSPPDSKTVLGQILKTFAR